MKTETIKQSIIPVVQQENTCIIGTTTPQGNDNFASQLMTKRDNTGETIFNAVRIGKPCDECIAKKVLCKHVENATAEGLSRKKRARLAALYEGDESVMMREFMGEITDTDTPSFPMEFIQNLLKKPPIKINPPVDMLLMCIDPAMTGENELAYLTMYYDRVREHMVIVHMDTINLPNTSDKHIISTFLRALSSIRVIPQLSMCPIVVACESAPQTFPQLYSDVIERMGIERTLNVHVMHEMPNNNAGTPKTHFNTLAMVHLAKEMLEMDKVYFSEHCCCSDPSTNVEKMKEKLVYQLTNFKKRRKSPASDFGNALYRLDGKAGGKNDDLAVTFIMAKYWYQQFWLSDKPEYDAIKAYSSSWRHNVSLDETISMNEYMRRQTESYNRKRQRTIDDAVDEAIENSTQNEDGLYSFYMNMFKDTREKEDNVHKKDLYAQLISKQSII